jgi:NADH-quinone oxidoreductase subunit L
MEAPTPISALIHAATMVNAGIYLLARFYPAFALVPGWRMAVIIVGVVSALMTAVMAITATDFKRALAYSTVSQLGYMIYAIGAGGILASQFHLLSHAVFKALLFLTAGAVIHAVGTRDMRRMGALGSKMPLARNAFIIGGLALMGLPILNGFWSKELILEIGLEGSPSWAYFLMLIGAGLTAFYTIRMIWLVFLGKAREELPEHKTAFAMKLPLVLLAIGSGTTWLLFGGLGRLFAASLPFHGIEGESTLQMVKTIIFAPASWLALLAVALGLGLFLKWGRQSALTKSASWISTLTETSFGLESINQFVVNTIRNFAEALRATQTGQLNWNILGILSALLVVLAVLLWGAA